MTRALSTSSVLNFPPPGGELRVLHLEDNVLDQELVAITLEGTDLPWVPLLRQVDNAEAFLTALSEFSPHLVLSDFSLPGYDGLSAFEAARSAAAHLPFIIVTGAMGEEVAVDTLRRGVTDYVLKQRLERLVPAVQRAIAEAAERSRRELAEGEIRALNAALQVRLQEVERLGKLAEEGRLKLEATAKQLEEALNLQKTFLAETSHELRTPLTALLGYLRRVEREFAAVGAPPSQTLSDAQRVAENMTRLVNDLLQLSRGELVQSIEPHFVNLGEVLRAVGRDYGIAVEVPELEIVGDPGRLTQVFVNLVTNAVRVTGSASLVSIHAREEGAQVKVCVIDHGPGIPDEVKPRIFDKFYRGKEAGSAGLGLTIAQQVISAHGGHINVLDTPGGGATFEVCLPSLDDDDDWEGGWQELDWQDEGREGEAAGSPDGAPDAG
ncbi:hybrid sensor histidine kinase/response regulator [Deinococcus irradiatisoli]|uniref:histidine kinase n=1 Tax=Deinococcus irradiatisoli TaxID=2202254 RepID=A0A2Z3JRH8_9DEIO|nr:ATP-binding protein [Deinococcus irradiatisoli]AWN23958.1 hybrid sensor histidine kinase/response regulator [Deinococcus irradiatisoli]